MLSELFVYVYLEQDGWVPGGILEYEERGRLSLSRFRYGKKYLKRSNAIALDPVQLPLNDQTFTTPDGFALFNGIRDDDHPRNFGFVHVGRNEWDLSPLYDVIPASVHTQAFALAMTIGTDGKRASIANALSLCERFRLSPNHAKDIIRQMQGTVAGWREHFRAHGFCDQDIRALENSFSTKP